MQQSLPSITEIAKAGTFGLKLPALPANPFVGLRPFNSDEALLYFGRSEQTIELLQQLHRTHFVAIVGSSGCGKSSLVRAGLIPKLKAGFLVEERDQWLIVTMKPGDAPLQNLAEALSSQSLSKLTPLTEAIHAGDVAALLECLTPALTNSDANLLLLIDQFEELFRFGLESNKPNNRAKAKLFVELMLALSEQKRIPIYVVMTMRSDFIGDCDNFYGLPEAINRSLYLVPRLTREQLRQAIEGPIHLFGGAIAEDLLNRVLEDIGDKSDQLPPMQHALMRTWERWQSKNPRGSDSQLGLSHYEAAGTITNALSNDADAALNGLTPYELKIAQRIFCALTDTDENNRRIRRPAQLGEIFAVAEADPTTVSNIILRFTTDGRSFLTVSGGSQTRNLLIDISHESLIRQWRQLSKWIDAENNSRDLYLRLANAANRHRTGRAELWRGVDLQDALAWREHNNPNAAWAARYNQKFGLSFNLAIKFLEESFTASQHEAKELEKKRKRSQRIAWGGTSVITLLLLVLIASIWFAIQQDNKYRQEIYKSDINTAEEEFKNQHYSRTMDLLIRYLSERLIFFQKDVRDQQWQELWQQMHNEFATLNGHKDTVWAVVFSPDGKTLVSASGDRTIRLWSVAALQYVTTNEGHTGPVRSVSFSPDGNTLASASEDGTVRLWNVVSQQNLVTLKGHKSAVRSVTFSPDGKIIASASEDSIKLWDSASQQNIATLDSEVFDVSSIAFSPNGKTLASASGDSTIKLWDMASRRNVATLKGHEGGVNSVTFSPNGKTFASAGYDRTVKLWNTASWQNIATLTGHELVIWSVAFSPDGKTLASASYDKTIRLWDLTSRQNIATLKGHEADVFSIAFSPDGRTLASASADHTVKLWNKISR